jgi:hypothetical protein
MVAFMLKIESCLSFIMSFVLFVVIAHMYSNYTCLKHLLGITIIFTSILVLCHEHITISTSILPSLPSCTKVSISFMVLVSDQINWHNKTKSLIIESKFLTQQMKKIDIGY